MRQLRAGAQAVLDQALEEEDMIRRMADQGLAPEIERTRAEKARAEAQARLDDIEQPARLARHQSYPTPQAQTA